MKIAGTIRQQATLRTTGKPASGGRFKIGDKSRLQTGETSSVSETPMLSTLIALQGRNDQADHEIIDRSHDILGILETLQRTIVDGDVTEVALRSLVEAIEADYICAQDPHLEAIQSQILLRARVELAKRNQ